MRRTDALPALAAGPAESNEKLHQVRPPGKLEAQILELANSLQPGQHIPVNMSKVTKNNFTGRVYKMRMKAKLGLDFGVNKTATGGFALVRYTAPRKGTRGSVRA